MEIEQRAYEFPWSFGTLKGCLRSGYYCCVYLQGTHLNASPVPKGKGTDLNLSPELLGYAVMSIVAGEAQILNICIDPNMQGEGLGRRLLQHLIAEAGRQSADTVFLEVRSSNQAAFALYDSAGFNEIGQRRGYYPAKDGREDALVLALAL
jgi:ribosomal-protein-alanine N-acetyltransferase